MSKEQPKDARNEAGQGMSRRDFLYVAGLGGMAAALAACAAPPPEIQRVAETVVVEVEKVATEIVEREVEVPVEVEKVVTATPPPPGPKRTTLRLQSSYPVDYPNTLVLAEDVFAEFKDTHPDFDVEVGFVRVPDVASTFVQALSAGQAPDFFYAFESQGTLGYLGYAYNLTDLVKEEGLWDDFYDSAKDLWTFSGQLVGIPTYFGVKCYVYRADVWDEAGLDPDAFPTTWEEFQDAVIKLTKKDASGNNIRDGYQFFEGNNVDTEHMTAHMHQNGGSEYESADALSPSTWNAPEAKEAFTWFLDLARKYGVESLEGTAAPEGANGLMDGYSGVEMQGPWWVPSSHMRFPEEFEQGLVRVGAPLTRKQQVGHLDASGWIVNAECDILEEVLDFIRLFLKDEYYMKYHDTVSADGETEYMMPCSRRSINESPDFWIADEPVVSDTAYLEAFDYGRSPARTHLGFVECRTYVYPRATEQALYQIRDDQSILDDAAAQMDAITERTQRELQ